MSYCASCGSLLDPDVKFCPDCGTPVNTFWETTVQAAPVVTPVNTMSPAANTISPSSATKIHIPLYHGVQREFSFMGRTLIIPAAMDTFNHYRKEFRSHARQAVNALTVEYTNHVFDLDTFLQNFSIMYGHCRKPLLEAAVNLLPEAGIYDVSFEVFEERHTKDFCLCGNDLKIMMDCFNATISANQNKKIQTYNMMPGLVFRGIGGFFAATALNYASASMLEASIRNAHVTPAQRAELFSRLNPNLLMEHAYLDYWRVFLSLTGWMHRRGLDVWYPNDAATTQADGLFQNMCALKLPEEKNPDFVITLLQTNPYSDNYFKYINWKYADSAEVIAINNYFGFDGNNV
ncbi:MAG: zinc ribbon domain-containing protein [Lachnospiraceae bacterium]|nr:zinc ribbon domain-containing protein [Lachnospiraceae bacterium]